MALLVSRRAEAGLLRPGTYQGEVIMRLLNEAELAHVTGAGGSYSCGCYCPPPSKPHKSKGNNGYGNGGHDGVPGRSGKQDNNR